MWLLIFTVWHKKKDIRGYETLTHTITKAIGDKINKNERKLKDPI